MDPLLLLMLILAQNGRKDQGQANSSPPQPQVPVFYPPPFTTPYVYRGTGGSLYGPWTQYYPSPYPIDPNAQNLPNAQNPQGIVQTYPPTPYPTYPQPQQPPAPAPQPQFPFPVQIATPPIGPGTLSIGPTWPSQPSGIPAIPPRLYRRIKPGDTGSSLSQKATGTGGRWKEILAENPELSTYTDAKKQTQIKPWAVGQKIYLPSDWQKAADGIEPATQIPMKTGLKVHNYSGLRKALQTDTEGVQAVFSVLRRIPIRPERLSDPVPVWHELASDIETESSWKPDAVNPVSKATGLIQFMPATAKRLGTTIEDLLRMSRTEQAVYVEKYLKGAAQKGYRYQGDMYLTMAYPAALEWDADRVIAEPGSLIWQQNPSWRDSTAGGKVTVRRVREVGRPPPVPEDLRAQILGLVPDLESALSLNVTVSKPVPVTSKPATKTPTVSKSDDPFWSLLAVAIVLGVLAQRVGCR